MKRKKNFVTPRVLQEVQIQLEKGCLLARSADDVTVATDGMYFEDTTYGEDDQIWE